jgi:hypothetical protein
MAQQTRTPGGQKKSSGAAPPANGAGNGLLGGLRSFFTPAPPANGAGNGLLGGLRSFFTPAPPANTSKSGATSGNKGGGATPARPALNLRKVVLGFLLLLVGVYAIQFLLYFLDIQVFKGKLQRTTVLPSTVPLLGGLTLYSLLAIALMIGLWIMLLRFDLLPRANRTQAQASAANANNRVGAAKKPAAVTEKTASAARQPITGPNDDEYEQARLAQRARRRRGARK